MSDYIKREDALEQFDYYDLGEYLTTQIRDMLMDIPSADVAPVRHGRWIKISPAGIYECSECQKNVKDCACWHENTQFCDKFSALNVSQRTPADGFCKWGERKEDE